MEEFFSRSEALLGAAAMEALRTKRVILFGVGGVGSWCAEALIRTGLMHLTIVDDDVVQASNVNRQLPATRETIGRPKVEVLKERLLEINPDADIVALQQRYSCQPSDVSIQPFNFQLLTLSLTPSTASMIRQTLLYARRACAGVRCLVRWVQPCGSTRHRYA